jgi:radical SAM-linked protein
MTFGKEGPARYISHLDLTRAIERALNRAQLPVAYSQGFNRRLRLSLAAALPLGYTSEAELADIWLVERFDPPEFQQRLMAKMPPGLPIHRFEEVALQSASLPQQVVESIYEVRFLDPIEAASLRAGVTTLLASPALWHRRQSRNQARIREIDLRPLIVSLEVHSQNNDEARLLMRLKQTPEQTGRPDDVLAALAIDPLDVHVHRRAIILASPG